MSILHCRHLGTTFTRWTPFFFFKLFFGCPVWVVRRPLSIFGHLGHSSWSLTSSPLYKTERGKGGSIGGSDLAGWPNITQLHFSDTTTKGNCKYQFYEVSNTDDQNILICISIDFVFPSKILSIFFLFTIRQFKTTENNFSPTKGQLIAKGLFATLKFFQK